MRAQLFEKMEEIVEYTTKLSYPMFASEHRKQEVIAVERGEIDSKFDAALLAHGLARVANDVKTECWETAVLKATCEFTSLPNKLKNNSFYLQEVMYKYASGILTYLKEKIENK